MMMERSNSGDWLLRTVVGGLISLVFLCVIGWGGYLTKRVDKNDAKDTEQSVQMEGMKVSLKNIEKGVDDIQEMLKEGQ